MAGKLSFLFIFTCSLLFGNALEDGTNSLSGVVLDATTKEPLPFAHVRFGDTGTVTNESGEYVVGVKGEGEYPLKVSFIGYDSYSDTLVLRGNTNLHVELQPAPIELNTVIVRTGIDIMEKVLARAHINYDLGHQTILSYYKEKLEADNEIYYLAEGILDIYLPSSTSSNEIQVSPLKTRKKVSENVEHNEFLKVYGHVYDMVQSIIWREESFISPYQLRYYDFQFEGTTLYDGLEVFMISFQPYNDRAKFSGKLYVDSNSFAIIRAEYFPDTSKSKLWDNVRWIEEFTESDELWYLKRVTYEGMMNEEESQLHFESMMIANHIENVKIPPAMGLLLEEEDQFFDEAENFNEDFWDGYTHVKLSVQELSSLR